MNHIYRSIWNEHTDSFVAVSENANSGGKKMSAAASIATGAGFALKALVASLLLAFGSTGYALPTGGKVVAGSATVTSGNGSMTVNQTSQNAALNWQSFNISASEAVRFVQPNSSSVALNRVIGADPSSILGSLSANGKVFLVNPNGILFGKGASVNVGGLVASTRDISDSDFMAGNYKFVGAGDGNVLNQGSINADGGYVALLGAHVSNEGTINARLGTVALAAGNGITLDVVGDGLLNVAVNEGAVNALVQNGGMIRADGGQVLLTAQAAGNLLQTVVNNTGVIQAQTIENHNGIIKLLGDMQSGAVNVGGTLDASAPDAGNGGFIETSAAHVKVSDDARITTLAPEGNAGTWLIDPTDYTVAASGGDITGAQLSANLGSTNVTIFSSSGASGTNGDVNVNDAVTWSANKLTLNAQNNININTAMNGSGTASLALQYGQSAIAAGNTSTVNVNAPVNLPSGNNFSTKQGSNGSTVIYTVINSLGAAGSTTATDLQGMNGNKAINYALGSNINASATSAWNAGAGFTSIGDSGSPFTGTFDGLGHTINGMFIDRSSTSSVGLFGRIGNTGETRNVGLTEVKITGDSYVGGLAGYNDGGSISNSYVTGQVVGSLYTAGMVGVHKGGIDNSYATATVNGSDLGTGGLVGYSIGSISNSYATGPVVGGGHYTGGLVGVNKGSISNSYATGTVNGGGHAVGGLVGINGQFAGDTGSIGNSYATGNVSGAQNDVGGLVGENYTDISNSYATGSVSSIGVDAGGLVGIQYNGVISQTYATGAVNGNGFVGGLIGRQNNGRVNGSYWDSYSTGQTVGVGTGLATGMTAITSDPSQSGAANYAFKQSAYTDFDFTSGTGDWFMVDGSTRPFLQSEYSTTIHNSHQLQLMAMDLAATYTLATDIDVSETGRAVNSVVPSDASGMWSNAGFDPLGKSADYSDDMNPIPASPFTGTLNGLGHIISNLNIARPTEENVGLFRIVQSGATVKNVGLVGGSVTGLYTVGALAGTNTGVISDSYATANVNGRSSVGGLVGNNGGTISGSYATGNINDITYTDVNVISSIGGLVGFNNAVIDNSYSTGNVNGTNYMGGLVGMNEPGGMVRNSYATGNVVDDYSYRGNYWNGGLVGFNTAQIITSYASGSVIDNIYNGGLVGYSAGGGTITDSYWNSATNTKGIGTNNNGASATGLSAADMQTVSAFSGFDFTDTWVMQDASPSPMLRSFVAALTVPPVTAPGSAPVNVIDSNPRNQNAIASAESLMSALPSQGDMADAQLPSPQNGSDASMQGGLAGLKLSITGDGVKMPSACNEEMQATTGPDC